MDKKSSQKNFDFFLQFPNFYHDYMRLNCFSWCLDHGFRCFPLARAEKIPIRGYHWTDPKFQLSDVESMIPWVDGWHPSAGLPASDNGLVIVDLDVNKETGESVGLNTLLELLHGRKPETFAVRSPSGGQHYYFKSEYADRFKNQARQIGQGIDIRARGGYVVAPYSYTNKGQYLPLNELEIAALPEEIEKLIPKVDQARVTKVISHVAPVTNRGFNQIAAARVAKYLRNIQNAVNGNRNNTFSKNAGQCLRYVSYIPEFELLSQLQSIGEAIGLKSSEVRNTLESAKKYAQNHLVTL